MAAISDDALAVTKPIRTVAVFCGSRVGGRSSYSGSVVDLGRGLAERGVAVVYGGGRIGLMGRLADAALGAGGTVIGIIPEFLSAREVAHAHVTELVTTESMHARKQLMFARADAFITMPGGLGTLDVTGEFVTWRQLGLHDKRVLIVDMDGWARGVVASLEATIADGFADPSTLDLFEVHPDVPSVLRRVEAGSHSTSAVSPDML